MAIYFKMVCALEGNFLASGVPMFLLPSSHTVELWSYTASEQVFQDNLFMLTKLAFWARHIVYMTPFQFQVSCNTQVMDRGVNSVMVV